MKEKLIKKVLGQRVYLKVPKIGSGKIQLTQGAIRQLHESIKENNQLEVYAVGQGIEGLSEGDKVRVDEEGMMRSQFVKLSDDVTVLQVSFFDIAHIW